MKRVAIALAACLVACQRPGIVALPDAGIARSPDGHVAFVRPTPNRLVATALGDEQATELWIADADGSHARRLVTGTSADSIEHAIASISAQQFSPDGRLLYFQSSGWVTSGAIHVVDVATGRERFVTPGNGFSVIPRGPLAGCLLVTKHRYRPSEGGSYDATWLVTGDGREVSLAAPDSADADRRIAVWMSGAIPPDAAATSLAGVHCTG